MTQSIEIYQLVMRNFKIMEQAPNIAEEIQTSVFAAIQNKVNEWADRKSWNGVYEYLTQEFTIKDAKWGGDATNGYHAYYAFGTEQDETKANYYISTLIGAVNERWGIHFGIDQAAIMRIGAPGRAKKWKTFLAESYANTDLRATGFELSGSGSNLFLPIHLDANELSEAYPDSLDDALTPVDKSLEKLEAAHTQIDALLQSALRRDF
jgi:hypothetical protein